MVDVAQQAFSTKNYDLAAEIYDRTIRERGPSVDLYLGLADSYARGGRLQTAFRAYANAFRCASVTPDQLTNLVTALVDKMAEKDDIKLDRKAKLENQLFACDFCKGIWNEPVTIACGHTYCRKCVEKTQQTCKKCTTTHLTRLSNVKSNVLLSTIVDKWFSDEVRAAQLKAQGNSLFSARKYEEAIDVYTQAFALAPTDHLVTSNRSFAFASLDRFEEAVKDAELTIKIRPDWAKGYYRKGFALGGLGCHELAAMAFLQCLTLDATVTMARTALAKTLHKLFSNGPVEDLKVAGLQSVLSSPLAGAFSVRPPMDTDSLVPFGGGVDENLLEQIKTRLRETLIQNGFLQASSDDQGYNTPQNQSPFMARPAERPSDGRCLSAPNSRPQSPKTRARAGSLSSMSSSSTSSSFEDLSRLTRKRSVHDVRRETSKCTPTKNQPHNIEDFFKNKAARTSPQLAPKAVRPELLDREDFECALCYRLLHYPVTTPCGHSYCKQCLDRSLDHNSTCPLCKSSLVEYLAERRQASTEAIDAIIQTYFPDDYAERQKIYEEELAKLARMDQDKIEVPVFVCTLAYPTISCPLHIFEPRYRLMIRQCMESGTRQFGMCIQQSNDDTDFSDIGTMLEVRNVQYFPDGRSVVDTVGGRRFKVISRGHRDGYNTAKVEFLKDNAVPEGPEKQELEQLMTEVHSEARDWYSTLSTTTRERIRQHFGDFPEQELEPVAQLTQGPAWLWWVTAVMPLEQRAQMTVLAMTSLKDRLSAVRRVLVYVRRQRPC